MALPRQPQDVFSEVLARDSLIRLNPEIAARPEQADEVLYKLRAIVLSVRSDGLIRAGPAERRACQWPPELIRFWPIKLTQQTLWDQMVVLCFSR